MIEPSVAILAVVLALIVTGQATPWTMIAYAIFLGGTYLICLVLRLTGWHRLWEPSFYFYTEPPGGLLYLSLNFKWLPAMRLATVRPEFVCEVRGPSGALYKTRPGTVYGGGSLVTCSYPRDFDAAPSPRPGVYTVVWKERRPRRFLGGSHLESADGAIWMRTALPFQPSRPPCPALQRKGRMNCLMTGSSTSRSPAHERGARASRCRGVVNRLHQPRQDRQGNSERVRWRS